MTKYIGHFIEKLVPKSKKLEVKLEGGTILSNIWKILLQDADNKP